MQAIIELPATSRRTFDNSVAVAGDLIQPDKEQYLPHPILMSTLSRMATVRCISVSDGWDVIIDFVGV